MHVFGKKLVLFLKNNDFHIHRNQAISMNFYLLCRYLTYRSQRECKDLVQNSIFSEVWNSQFSRFYLHDLNSVENYRFCNCKVANTGLKCDFYKQSNLLKLTFLEKCTFQKVKGLLCGKRLDLYMNVVLNFDF